MKERILFSSFFSLLAGRALLTAGMLHGGLSLSLSLSPKGQRVPSGSGVVWEPVLLLVLRKGNLNS